MSFHVLLIEIYIVFLFHICINLYTVISDVCLYNNTRYIVQCLAQEHFNA